MSHLSRTIAGQVRRTSSVPESDDFWRIDGLPRHRALSPELQSDWVALYTESYRTPWGGMKLRPIQAVAINTLRMQKLAGRGALLPMGVGSGKTLVSLLAPTIYNSQRPVLFTYASLVEKTRRDIAELSAHWIISRRIKVLSWESLSTQAGAEQLSELAPDLVIADECHAVKAPTAARTNRFCRYFDTPAGAGAILVALSGTLTTRALADFAHISALALGQGSPVPLDARVLTQWDLALGETVPAHERWQPGVLSRWAGPNESVREAYRRRLVETPGVVATSADALGTALNIHKVKSFGSAAIKSLLSALDRTQCDPDGNELESPADVARVAKTLALGYWLRWEWPGGQVDTEWLRARNEWNRAVRAYLSSDLPRGLDSPGLVAKACGLGDAPTPALDRAWREWGFECHKPQPPVVAHFSEAAVTDLARFVTDWAAQGGGIVWVPGPAIGAKLADLTGLPYYPAGRDPSTSTDECILASVASHGVGKNLQGWDRNLVLIPPASGNAWEQLLGRTHRPGQTSDTVQVTVCLHHHALHSAWESALSDAIYIQATTGNSQKLCAATIVDQTPGPAGRKSAKPLKKGKQALHKVNLGESNGSTKATC